MLDPKYDFKLKEKKWMDYWNEREIYKFKLDQKEVYSIDTPPPNS